MTEPNKGGRPAYQPTEADRNTVRSMAACGFSQIAIARCIGTDGINPETLRIHFRRELDTAMDMANARIGQVAFQKATEGEAWAVCFWMKCRAGWKETQVTEHAGSMNVNTSGTEALTSRIASLAARSGTGSSDSEPQQ